MNRIDLLEAMSMAKPAISSQDYLPVLQHFCFDTETLHAYNDNLGIEVEFLSDLDCALPGNLLQSLVGKFSAEEILFKQTDDKIELRCGRNKTLLPFLPPTEFVPWMPDEEHGKARFKADGNFLLGLDRCKEFVGNDATRLSEIGVTLISDNEGKAALYATDNITLSRQSLKLSHYEGEAMSVIVPTAWCSVLITLTNSIGDEEVDIEIGDGYILADISHEAKVFARLIEAEPHDFESIIKGTLDGVEFEKSLSVPPSDFYAALDRNLVILSVVQDKEIDITLRDNTMRMACRSELGEAEDDVSFDVDFAEFDFKIDPEHLVRAGKRCSKIAFLENVVVAKEGSFLHVISHTSSD